MAKIKLLPPSVIQQIAAGEVAERPAVIIKELIENSLDAGATEIEVHLRRAGMEQIIVSDNGEGMDETDLKLAHQRHTTSKIHQPQDLWQIKTLGFRGEALASIAQVAHLQLISRPPVQASGFKIVVHQDLVLESRPIATQVGTTVVVEQLFADQPVRKKFLKNQATELKEILRVISAAAISQPTVEFLLKNDNELLLHVRATSDTGHRIFDVLGVAQDELIPIDCQQANFSVTGFLGSTQTTYTQAQQFFSLNHRPVSYPAFNKAIKNAYGTLLEKTAFPTFILNLTLPPEKIDLHIHPRKEMIQVADEKLLLAQITQTVSEVLKSNAQLQSPSPAPWLPPNRSFYPQFKTQILNEKRSDVKTNWQPEAQTNEILQIDLTYLALPTAQGLLLVDQHAAHERILYEEFLAQLKKSSLAQTSTELPQPLNLNLSLSQVLSLLEAQAELKQAGFQVSQTGRKQLALETVPSLFTNMPASELQSLMMKVLKLIDDNNFSLPTLTHELVARLACRTAIQAGDFLTPAQRLALVEQLAQTPNHTNCPHGRPTTILVDIPTLEKKFKRRK